MPSPYNATVPILTNVIYLYGGDDDPNWYTDNRELWRWNQQYGDYFTLVFWEADGGLNTGTITIDGHNYGYQRPGSRDELGQVTYSWYDRALTTSVDGRGIGRWGANTGRIACNPDRHAVGRHKPRRCRADDNAVRRGIDNSG
jgi:hypothetical protein